VESGKCEIQFPITIRRQELPVLQFRTDNRISSLVTIVTKTLMRYKCLDRLVTSAEKFYPGIKIIVADDSPPDELQHINQTVHPNVKHYIMPPMTGWFAGRALAISQVIIHYA